MKPALTVVIPAKNEEERIVNTLERYCSFVKSNYDNEMIEILIVTNDSEDNTASVVREFSEKFSFVRNIETTYETGKGGAVALGFSEAKGAHVGFIDADGAVAPEDFFKLVRLLLESPDIDGVIGNRSYVKSDVSFTRRFIIRLYNLYVKLFFKIKYSDTQCGAKIFKAHQAKEIAKRLNSLGWVFDLNILLICKYLNYNIIEKPVKWVEMEGSKFSLTEALTQLPFEFFSLKRLELSYYARGLAPFQQFFDKQNIVEKDSKRKSILIVMWRDIKHPLHGGSEIYTFNVAKRLAKENDVLWFTSKPPNFSSRDEIEGVKIFRRGGLFTVYIWAAVYYLFKFKDQVDYIVDTENGMSFFTPLYVRKPIVFIIHHIHGIMWFKEFLPPLSIIGFVLERYLMPIVYRRKHVITVSPSSKNEISKLGFKEKRIYLAYNAINTDGNIVRYERSKEPLFLYHGRLKAYKRVDIAIKAFSKLLDDFPNAKLVISGAGSDYKRLEKLVNMMGLKDKVKLLGYVSDETKWELMQKAWVFLMPSVVEGWGITIIEAALCGTPTVGFNVLGIRDSVRHDLTGILSQNEEEFYKNIKLLVNDRNLREQMGENCRLWANMFSWDKTAEIIEQVIMMTPERSSLLSDKIYPWNLETRPDFINSIANF